jgi:hypothetical protein
MNPEQLERLKEIEENIEDANKFGNHYRWLNLDMGFLISELKRAIAQKEIAVEALKSAIVSEKVLITSVALGQHNRNRDALAEISWHEGCQIILQHEAALSEIEELERL